MDKKPPPDDLAEVIKQSLDDWHDDSDRVRPYWDRMHDHWWDRTWQRLTSTAGKWLIGTILFGAAGWIVTYAVRSGWIK